MKSVVLTANLTGFSTRSDKSVTIRAVSPELSPSETVSLFELQGLNVRLLIEPMDYAVEEKLTVQKEISGKTPSERLRSILFVGFRYSGEQDFTQYYLREMERICQHEKDRLPKQPF